jgi:uncharacterized protein YndB with AHSA1/START domain
MAEQIRQGDIPGVQLRCRHRFPVAPKEVWAWLTDADALTRWLAARADLEPEPDKALVLEITDPSGRTLRERWVTLTSNPPDRWVVDLLNLDGSWPVPTRVIFELTPVPEGTEISVLQKGFAHLPLSECLTIWEAYRRRWRTALTNLAGQIANP